MNSCRKGKAGERELAAWLREHGVAARRGVQHAGGPESPDVVADLPGIHLEVKRTECLRILPALAQAAADAEPGDVPVVLWRCNRGRWVAVLDGEAWLNLVLHGSAPVRCAPLA